VTYDATRRLGGGSVNWDWDLNLLLDVLFCPSVFQFPVYCLHLEESHGYPVSIHMHIQQLRPGPTVATSQ